jgi:hypothetical protein
MAVACGKCVDKMRDARLHLTDDPLFFSQIERDRPVERTLESCLEVRHDGVLSFRAFRIAALPRLELKFLRRTTRTNPVLLIRILRVRDRVVCRARSRRFARFGNARCAAVAAGCHEVSPIV